MEQTIRNMELVLSSVKKEMKEGNYIVCKTLMNTYRTLLQRFTYLPSRDKRIDEYKIILNTHKDSLQKLHVESEISVENAIKNGSYKFGDVLVEVAWRLDRASADIVGLIKRREDEVKRHNRDISREVNSRTSQR